jgi:hypothetical protein
LILALFVRNVKYNDFVKSTRLLSDEYCLIRSFDLSKELRLLIWLNVAGLILFFIFGALFFLAILRFYPNRPPGSFSSSKNFIQVVLLVLVILAAYVSTLFLHEVVHGLFFWLFTRSKPSFGLRTAYAFAAAPNWFIPRNQYMVIGLAPLIVITFIGMAVLPYLPSGFLTAWWVSLTTNASGAVGDLFIVGWLLVHTSQSFINDFGDRVAIYAAA